MAELYDPRRQDPQRPAASVELGADHGYTRYSGGPYTSERAKLGVKSPPATSGTWVKDYTRTRVPTKSQGRS